MNDPVLIVAFAYFAAISLISAIITAVDKAIAKSGGRRIPEATLLILAAVGGSIAMYLTMQLIRHKTKHIKFMLGIPIIILFQAVVVIYVVTRFF